MFGSIILGNLVSCYCLGKKKRNLGVHADEVTQLSKCIDPDVCVKWVTYTRFTSIQMGYFISMSMVTTQGRVGLKILAPPGLGQVNSG